MFICRSLEVRRRLVKEYDINPIAHVRLLNGQERRSCTGNLLKDSYYCFSYRKKNDNISKYFLCGSYAAKDFLDLIKQPELPLFDPLASDSVGVRKTNSSGIPNIKETWHPAAKELHNAINLIIICWGVIPSKALQEIKMKLEKNTNCKPYIMHIKAINTIISRDKRGRTLQLMIHDLRVHNPKIRQFDFSLLNEILCKNDIDRSFFGVTQ